MKITARESFGKFLTKGKEYETQHVTHNSVLITDDTNTLSGWNLDRFDYHVHEVRPWEFYEPLYKFLKEEHNLDLLQGEIEELYDVVINLNQIKEV